MRFAERLGVSSEDRATTYWITLLVGSGCTAGSFEFAQIFGDDIAFRSQAFATGPSALEQLRYVLGWAGREQPRLARALTRATLLLTGMKPLMSAIHAHCAVNAHLAARVGLAAPVSSAVMQCYALWNGQGYPSGLKHEEIPLSARICAIADTAEVIHREHGVEAVIADARAKRGTAYDPQLADRWCELAPEVLRDLDGDGAWRTVLGAQLDRRLDEGELDGAFELLADYADLKSPWFIGHSRGVAELAAAAAREAGLAESDAAMVRRAALAHDLGRTCVPNTIWEKPGLLTHAERERVRLHAYYTDRILRRAGALASYASIASAAHERADGTGYPRAIRGETIPLLGRILACADTYHAMREARPHRAALSRDEASAELRRAARTGELDGAAVDGVLAAAGHVPHRRPSAPGGLTEREIDVLERAARGRTARQIAAELGIAPKTAANHIDNIYQKIGVSSRAEAALWAMRNGLVRSLDT